NPPDKNGYSTSNQENIAVASGTLLPKVIYEAASPDFVQDVHTFQCAQESAEDSSNYRDCIKHFRNKDDVGGGVWRFKERFPWLALSYAAHDVQVAISDQFVDKTLVCKSGPAEHGGKIVTDDCISKRPVGTILPGKESAQQLLDDLNRLAAAGLGADTQDTVDDSLRTIERIKSNGATTFLSLHCATEEAFSWLSPSETGDTRPSDQDGHLGLPPPPVGADDLGAVPADVAI
ncbi:MAG TPA: hypothetical protein VL588_05045, partial [Bdellovibrionota bacterium]|nr:hypothetical protein [Bdellovibrionota bacterium]